MVLNTRSCSLLTVVSRSSPRAAIVNGVFGSLFFLSSVGSFFQPWFSLRRAYRRRAAQGRCSYRDVRAAEMAPTGCFVQQDATRRLALGFWGRFEVEGQKQGRNNQWLLSGCLVGYEPVRTEFTCGRWGLVDSAPQVPVTRVRWDGQRLLAVDRTSPSDRAKLPSFQGCQSATPDSTIRYLWRDTSGLTFFYSKSQIDD